MTVLVIKDMYIHLSLETNLSTWSLASSLLKQLWSYIKTTIHVLEELEGTNIKQTKRIDISLSYNNVLEEQLVYLLTQVLRVDGVATGSGSCVVVVIVTVTSDVTSARPAAIA